MTTKNKSTESSPEEGATEAKPKKAGGGGATAVARKILEEENPQSKIAERRKFVSAEDVTKLYGQCEQISRMLSGLRSSLERKAN